MALELAHHLTNVFVQQSEWGIFHPNLVFEDRIRGEIRTKGTVHRFTLGVHRGLQLWNTGCFMRF